MRRLYIYVSLLFTACVLIFIYSFIYLDKTNHKVYHYVISLDNHDIGTVKVERFETADKIIYKTVTGMPFSPLFTEIKSRIVLDRKYNLENYTRERSGNAQTEVVYMENNNNLASFISRFDSEFVCLANIPMRKETFVFEEGSPETYLPVIENYDFIKGRSQGFNALTFFSRSLPPMNRFITLTSVRDGYINIDASASRRVKAENLLLKIKNYPQGSIWVAKSDRSLVGIEIPKKSLKITRTFRPRKLKGRIFSVTNSSYASEDIVFKNRDIELAGTITIPEKEGRHPAVLLVCGAGPQDRDYQGLFVHLADYLSQNGFCALRFDRRGIGSSGGTFSSSTDAEVAQDIGAALNYLAGRKEVDSKRVFIISHSQGAYYTFKAALEKHIPKGAILLAPSLYWKSDDPKDLEERMAASALKYKWSDEYLKLAARSVQETAGKVKNSNRSWISILRKRCFLNNVRDRRNEDPERVIIEADLPALILQGDEDETASLEFAPIFAKLTASGARKNYVTVNFVNLGHFFGRAVNDGTHKIYYEVDREALDKIKDWLEDKIAELSRQEELAELSRQEELAVSLSGETSGQSANQKI